METLRCSFLSNTVFNLCSKDQQQCVKFHAVQYASKTNNQPSMSCKSAPNFTSCPSGFNSPIIITGRFPPPIRNRQSLFLASHCRKIINNTNRGTYTQWKEKAKMVQPVPRSSTVAKSRSSVFFSKESIKGGKSKLHSRPKWLLQKMCNGISILHRLVDACNVHAVCVRVVTQEYGTHSVRVWRKLTYAKVSVEKATALSFLSTQSLLKKTFVILLQIKM